MTQYIIGADEVGYGCLAGPLVVCAVRAPDNWQLSGLKDSKKFKDSSKLSAHEKRLEVNYNIRKAVEKGEISFHLAERSSTQIDELGVAVALKDAYVQAFNFLYNVNDVVIADGVLKFTSYNLSYKIDSVIKADDKFTSVMAASILAKTYRDDLMMTLHNKYPNYDWINNVGYGSKSHLEAIEMHGPTNFHRFSYAPMKNMKVL